MPDGRRTKIRSGEGASGGGAANGAGAQGLRVPGGNAIKSLQVQSRPSAQGR
ncbi:hypothetical protein RC1_1007 [Rhodospirillum centenum SW]|uniref:Uncharacterized protein n=1 Tax=Rhodospirillum centenum (strain ATCC 51521 / SW) TaxID=414684 RepID=B6ISJ5_RHOCS|nr:hypothetical protein RC1_1007 [Rhodospirillum centenum SW]